MCSENIPAAALIPCESETRFLFIVTIGPESGNKEKAAVIGHRIVSQAAGLAAFDMGTPACAWI